MSSISIIIIDDEPKAIEVLERYCQQMDLLVLKAIFRDPLKATSYLVKEQVDVILLDIQMPGITGFDLIQSLLRPPLVIFTTAHHEYAVQSYQVHAVDYLLKPISFARFMEAIQKVSDRLNGRLIAPTTGEGAERIFFIKSGHQIHQVQVREILYLQKDGNYMTYHTINKKVLVRENMKDIMDRLGPQEFVRVHKSYVVALHHIDRIEGDQVIIGNQRIPIGRVYRDAFMQQLLAR